MQAQEIAEVTSLARTGKPEATNTPTWPAFRESGTLMSLAPGGDSELLPANLVEAIHHCGFWDRVAPKP